MINKEKIMNAVEDAHGILVRTREKQCRQAERFARNLYNYSRISFDNYYRRINVAAKKNMESKEVFDLLLEKFAKNLGF